MSAICRHFPGRESALVGMPTSYCLLNLRRPRTVHCSLSNTCRAGAAIQRSREGMQQLSSDTRADLMHSLVTVPILCNEL